MPKALNCKTLPVVLDLHSVVNMVVTTLDARDPSTYEHSYRVAGLAEVMAEHMALQAGRCRLVHYAAHLHDIGKIGVADQVLNKPGILNQEEFAELQKHPVIGSEILNKIPEFNVLATIVRHHHERWDGRGYPDGLAGEEIPLESRIISLVDAFDAMTSDRPYRRRKSHEWALGEIVEHAGSQFCPHCVETFLALRSKLKISQYLGRKSAFAGHRVGIEHDALMHSFRVQHAKDVQHLDQGSAY